MNVLKSSLTLIVVVFFISGCVSQDTRYENRQKRILNKIEKEAKKEAERIKRNSVPVKEAKKIENKKETLKSAPSILYDK